MSKDETPARAGKRQFDFWLGKWAVTWDGGGGTNQIERILDGQVILEQFDGTPDIPLRGMSVSTYDDARDQWKQTWVDNNGSYLDFTGSFRDGKMVLSREAVVEGEPVQQRMVWYHIGEESLEWNWERSDDGGTTWQTLWHIRYRRRA